MSSNSNTENTAPPAAHPHAYVMGVQWVSPLVRMDYPTHWNLLWRIGLSDLNANDDYKSDTPETVQRKIVSNNSSPPRWAYLQQYFSQVLRPYNTPMALDPDYYYTVNPRFAQPRWYDQQVMLGIPKGLLGEPLDQRYWNIYRVNGETAQVTQARAEEAAREPVAVANTYRRLVAHEVWRDADGWNEVLNPKHHVPTVTVDAGERSVGFFSLARALSFMHAQPQQTAWVMAMDAPDYPKDKQPSENAVLLILANPELRHPVPHEPLAAVYPVFKQAVSSRAQRVEAIKQAMSLAVASAGVNPAEIGRVFHDAGYSSDEAMRATASLAQAMSESMPELHAIDDAYNVDQYLKNAGAAAAAMNFAFATAYVHQSGKPALVVANRDPEAVYAVLFTPPPGHVVPAKRTAWGRARGMGHAYYPWWGAKVGSK